MSEDEPPFEIEHGHADYSAAELLEQAQANAQALAIATIAFLRQHGVPLTAWTEALGTLFGRAWGEPRPWDAAEFLDAMLTNLRALGARVVTVELGEQNAAAVTTGFPDPELCALLGVAAADAAAFNDVAAVIARDRGLRWTWQHANDQTHYLVTRGEG
jgi:hypothetical protein